MRTIIAGSRDCTDERILLQAVEDCGWVPTTVICGGARGADTIGKIWAGNMGIPCEIYFAEWDRYGKSAGYRRNELMADRADALIALWDGVSPGTKHMIDIARRKGLRVHTHLY